MIVAPDERRGPGRPRKETTPPLPTVPVVIDPVARKPTHDARIQYYKVLEYVLLTTKFSCLSGDYAGWYRGLRQFYVMIIGYVPADSLKDISELFEKAKEALDKFNNAGAYRNPLIRANLSRNRSSLDTLFFQIEEKLHIASKDMMLPTGGLQDGDLDVDDLLRNSGL